MKSSKKKLTISIIDYCKADRVVKSVNAINDKMDCMDFEISIIDNSCSIQNWNKLNRLSFRNVFLYRSPENIGYTRATNLSLKNVNSDYILILNPDIIIPDSFNFYKFLDNINALSNYSVIGVRQINDDGTIPSIARQFPNFLAQILRRSLFGKFPFLSKIKNSYEMKDFDYHKSQPVDWLQSSFWLIRTDVWFRIGGLDERFFLFMADPDFCLRAKRFDLHAYYLSTFYVQADGKRASAGGFKDVLTNKVLRYHIVDSVKYYIKWLNRRQ